jgi:hypothetical protein
VTVEIGGANPTVKAAGIVGIRGGKIYSVNNYVSY